MFCVKGWGCSALPGDVEAAQPRLSWHNAATGSGVLVLHGLCSGNAFPGKVCVLFIQQEGSDSRAAAGETAEPPRQCPAL